MKNEIGGFLANNFEYHPRIKASLEYMMEMRGNTSAS